MGPSWKPLRWLTNTGHGHLCLLLGADLLLSAFIFFSLGNINDITWANLLASGLPFFISMGILASEYGPPTKWWIPFFGQYMKVHERHSLRVLAAGSKHIALDLGREIDEWLKVTKPRFYHRYDVLGFKFLRKRDAVMFKLAWG